MRRMLLTGAILVASCAGAAAQVVIETPPADVYVTTPPSYVYEYRTYRTSPRVYRYYRDVDDDDVVVVRPRARAVCGIDHYWDGERCIYVRY